MNIQEDEGLRPGYVLKLNSYDLSVDIELADVARRLRFEHPEVRVLVVESGLDRVFCSGANIHMPGASTHAFNVNIRRFTDVRKLQRRLKEAGIVPVQEADESTTGPARFVITDPDGNAFLFDQHR